MSFYKLSFWPGVCSSVSLPITRLSLTLHAHLKVRQPVCFYHSYHGLHSGLNTMFQSLTCFVLLLSSTFKLLTISSWSSTCSSVILTMTGLVWTAVLPLFFCYLLHQCHNSRWRPVISVHFHCMLKSSLDILCYTEVMQVCWISLRIKYLF